MKALSGSCGGSSLQLDGGEQPTLPALLSPSRALQSHLSPAGKRFNLTWLRIQCVSEDFTSKPQRRNQTAPQITGKTSKINLVLSLSFFPFFLHHYYRTTFLTAVREQASAPSVFAAYLLNRASVYYYLQDKKEKKRLIE